VGVFGGDYAETGVFTAMDVSHYGYGKLGFVLGIIQWEQVGGI
jgi:hypothetical protein